MPIVRNCLAACAVLVCFTAQAQVLRCTDARTGQVTYTDGTCPGAASVREVEPRKTPQEIQLEREQATQALARNSDVAPHGAWRCPETYGKCACRNEARGAAA